MILSSETTANDAQQMLEFYKQNFAVVEIVSCSQCGSALAFECQGGDTMGLPVNEIGKVIIPIGEALQSSRVRLDEAPTGERMMGYQCGAPVPNPDYPQAVKDHEAAVTEYEKRFKNDVKLFEADQKKVKKGASAVYAEPIYSPPLMPNIPETVPCGNDTRVAEIERGKVPVGNMQISLSPFEKHQIRERIKEDRAYKADFKKIGNIKHFESFQVERV